MDDELYDLLFAVAHGRIREADQVRQIFSDAEKSLEQYHERFVEPYDREQELLAFAAGAFIDGWPEGEVRTVVVRFNRPYPAKASV